MKFQDIEKLANRIKFPKFLNRILVNMQFQDAESIASQLSQPDFRKENFINYMFMKEYVINDLVQARHSKEIFFSRYHEFFWCEPNLVSPVKHLSTGDLVTYTNQHGESYANHRILSFFQKPNGEVYLFLDIRDCFKPVSITDITLQKGYVGLTCAEDFDALEIAYQYNALPLYIQLDREKRQSAMQA
ncbi:hypothetical protein [Comamonas sp.]|uniref:hypothetical protein n=1 Tax=Comamonas sp. TaxID=34028 RepID=UPI0012C8E328|nr:hypothetical protein [Comamonas sp.]MPS92968.1 hypothetical protein [Comamonas sp.]